MIRTAIAALSMLALVACSTTPIAADQARAPAQVMAPELLQDKPGTGTLVILRDRGLSGSACLHTISVDGRAAAMLDNGEGVTFHLPAGQHLINVTSGRALCPNVAMSTEPNIVAGGHVIYRISLAADNALRLTRTQ